MEAKDNLDSQSTIQSKTETRRSIFDFLSVDDLRRTNDDQESDRVFSDKTQPTIPFNKSYIAYAPSRQLFTLNSRYTFFGGDGGSSKDINGSVEDLTGCTSKMKRNSNLGKFSKSSPDLGYSSYQTSDSYDVTKQERQEGLSTKLNIETNLANEKKYGNKESTKREKNNEFGNGNVGGIRSSTKPKVGNESMVRLETKWSTRTEFEARPQLSMSTLNFESTTRNTASTDDAMTNDQDTSTHVFYPGTKHFDDRPTSEISVPRYTDQETSEVFEKGWETILYSGRAELRKSSESLNSFGRGVNSRENVDFTDDFTDSVGLQESEVTEKTFEHGFEMGKNTMEYEIGTKRNDEMAGLDTLLWPEKRQKTSPKSENDIFSQFSEDSSSYSDLTTTVAKRSYIETTTKQDLKWMTTRHEQEYIKNGVNTNRVTTTLPQESTQSTANDNEEKQAFLSTVHSHNDNVKLFTTKKEPAGVDGLFLHDATCSDKQLFQTSYRNLPNLKATRVDGNYDRNVSTSNATNLSVLQMEEMVNFPQSTADFNAPRSVPVGRPSSDTTFDSEEISETSAAPSCSISQIKLKVLNDSTLGDENKVSQIMDDWKINAFLYCDSEKDNEVLNTKFDDSIRNEVVPFLPHNKGSLYDGGISPKEVKSRGYEESYSERTAIKVSGILQSSISMSQDDRSSTKYINQWVETKTGGEEIEEVGKKGIVEVTDTVEESNNDRMDILVDFGDETNEAIGLGNVKELDEEVQLKKGHGQKETKGKEKGMKADEEHNQKHPIEENDKLERYDWFGEQQQSPGKEGQLLNLSNSEIEERNGKLQTKRQTKSQTIGEQKASLIDDNIQTLSNSTVLTHEPDNNNTDIETKSVESLKETADNSLIENMMGMFCFLGLKDSPDGGFYNTEDGHYRGQKAALDFSNVENEQDLYVEETGANKPKVKKEIKKQLFTSTEEQAFSKENDTVSLIYMEENNKEVTNVDTEAGLGDYNNFVEALETQPKTLNENPQKEATVKDNISDLHTGSTTARKGKSHRDKDVLLEQKPETILPISDVENGKQEKVGEGRNTKVNIGEGFILHTGVVQDLLLPTPEDLFEENVLKLSESDEFGKQEETIAGLNMRESKATILSANTVDLLMNNQEEELQRVSQGSTTTETKNRSIKNTITTTHLNINRNKWSHSFIIPPRTMNIPNSKMVSGTVNVLILDSDLTLTSPKCKPTVVTLNLFPREIGGKNSRGHNNEISHASIQMNAEKETISSREDNISGLFHAENEIIEDIIDQKYVEPEQIRDEGNFHSHPDQTDYTKQLKDEHFTSNNKPETSGSLMNDEMKAQKHSKTQHLGYLADESTTSILFLGKVYEKSLSDSDEKETNESINDSIINREYFKNMQTDYFTELETDCQVQETVCKVNVKGMNDERLSEHLMCFEMDELVDEKIIKKESKQEEILPQLDEILLPDNEIREKISKEERDIKYELSPELDRLLSLEEMQENEAENNTFVILSRNDEVYSSEFTSQNATIIEGTQNMEDEYSTQSEKKVHEVFTKTVHDRCFQNKYSPQLDEMLKCEHVQEFVPDKMEVQHYQQHYLLETDRHFDFIKTAQLPVTEKIDDKQLEQSFELSKQVLDQGQQEERDEKSNGNISELVLYQNKEDIETFHTEKGRNKDGLYAWELNITENAFDFAVNEQEAIPAEERMSMSSKDNALFNTNDDHLALMISHSNYPGDTIHSQDDDDIWRTTASPIVDESSSIVSNYDASDESSSESTQNYTQQESEEDLTDEEEYVSRDITVSYSNPETMKSGFKVLKASYSNIQPDVHRIESEATHAKVSIDGKAIPPHIKKRPKISEQIYEMIELSSHPKLAQSAENNQNSDMDATVKDEFLTNNESQYRTTMNIQQNLKQVSTSYVILQRFGKQDSPRTYFELNYDMNEWKVGNKFASHVQDEPKKTFVVSYTTIEQVNNSQRARVHLPKTEEATYDEDIFNRFPSKEFTATKVPLIAPSTQQPVELNNTEFSSTKEPIVFQIPSASEEIILNQSPSISTSLFSIEVTQPFDNDEQTRTEILKSPTSSSPPQPSPPSLLPTTKDGSTLEVEQKEINSYGVQQQIYVPTKVLCQENIHYLPLPAEASATSTTEEAQQKENYHHVLQILIPPKENNLEDIFYQQVTPPLSTSPPPLQPVPTTTHTDVQREELNHYFSPKERSLENICYPPPPPPTPQTQAPLTSFTEEIQQESIKRNLLQKYSPPEIPPNLDTKKPNQHKVSIHYQVPSLVHTPPVWSFARSVFHSDGENKTFFKVIDDRNKYFQSSTFMYRGERVKVSRGVNVCRSDFENRTQGIADEQIIHCRVDEDHEGYSEIWDDGNLLADENEVMLEVDGPITRSQAFYELSTEQDIFNEQDQRNCSWYLKLHGNLGVCKLLPHNLDAIAIEDDNILLGSRGFVSGHHTWVIQGLGVFCAVGVCYPGEEVRRWFKGGKWVWTTDGLRYSQPHGIERSEFGQWRNEDVLKILLNCEDHKLTIVNTRTNVEATIHGFEGEVYPYFNIYKGSSIHLLETSIE